MLYSDCPVLVTIEITLHEEAAVDTTVLAAMLVSIFSKPRFIYTTTFVE